MSFKRPLIVRPPSEWKSYFLPLTSGCSNNTCTFCGYFGSKLQIRDIEGVIKEIDALAALVNYGLDIPGVEMCVGDRNSWITFGRPMGGDRITSGHRRQPAPATVGRIKGPDTLHWFAGWVKQRIGDGD